jgi:hypothetical protein
MSRRSECDICGAHSERLLCQDCRIQLRIVKTGIEQTRHTINEAVGEAVDKAIEKTIIRAIESATGKATEKAFAKAFEPLAKSLEKPPCTIVNFSSCRSDEQRTQGSKLLRTPPPVELPVHRQQIRPPTVVNPSSKPYWG